MEEKMNIQIGRDNAGNIVVGSVSGSVENVRDSFNTHNLQERKTLAETAAEIQQLLKQLEQSNPSATDADKISYVNDETTPSFKRRAIGALKAACGSTIEEFLDNPYVNVGKAVIEGWVKPD